jgi:hypothetical protein
VSNRDGQTYMTVEEFVTEEMKNDPEFAPAFGSAQGGNLRERFGGGPSDPASKAKAGEDRFLAMRKRKFGSGGR